MKAVVQRVKGPTSIVCRDDAGAVLSNGDFTGAGLVVLLGWSQADGTVADLAAREEWIVSRVKGLRIFPDAEGRMNLSLADYLKGGEGGILWVPQFTLAAKLESGFRPSFTDALAPAVAKERFETTKARLLAETAPYAQVFGEFGADMDLSFTNWGPVTIPLER